jgi:hypothetical protein
LPLPLLVFALPLLVFAVILSAAKDPEELPDPDQSNLSTNTFQALPATEQSPKPSPAPEP